MCLTLNNPNTVTLTLIVLVPAPRPRIEPNRRLRARGTMSSDDNRYPILTCICRASQNITCVSTPLLPKTLTLTLTLIVLVPAPRPRIEPNRRLRARGPMSSDDNRYPILTYMPCLPKY